MLSWIEEKQSGVKTKKWTANELCRILEKIAWIVIAMAHLRQPRTIIAQSSPTALSDATCDQESNQQTFKIRPVRMAQLGLLGFLSLGSLSLGLKAQESPFPVSPVAPVKWDDCKQVWQQYHAILMQLSREMQQCMKQEPAFGKAKSCKGETIVQAWSQCNDIELRRCRVEAAEDREMEKCRMAFRAALERRQTEDQRRRDRRRGDLMTGCGSAPPQSASTKSLLSPENAAWQDLKEAVSDEALALLVTRVAGPVGGMLVILRGVVATYKVRAAQNALVHVRSAYDDKNIVLLGLRPSVWQDRETSMSLLRRAGGTVWVQEVPLTSSDIGKAVLWHPDPDFRPDSATGRMAMHQPECTAERPFGGQAVKPILRER